MQKTVPLEYGHYYHIYNRGNNRENIFFEDKNYHYFLKLYVKYIMPIADTYAYCLLKNHFHFLVRIKSLEEQTSQLSQTSQVLRSACKVLKPIQQFSNFFNSYTKAINKAHQRTGRLFQHRFSRILVDSNRYFIHLIAYIHRNPQKHGFVNNFRDYPYSSYQAIRFQKASRIKTDKVLDWFGNLDNFDHLHQIRTKGQNITHLIGDDLL